MSTSAANTIMLFDVDGTLTLPRQPAYRRGNFTQKIDQTMRDFLIKARQKVPLAVVGGSDLPKIVEQLGDSLKDVLTRFDYVFTENGLVGFHNEQAFPVKSIKQHVGDDRLNELINFTLRTFSEIDLPVKRGNFIEFRNGMLNLSPIGRSCTQEERMQFVEYDKQHDIRQKFVEQLKAFVNGWNLNVCIGGQISVDVFPIGWDKTFCLQYLTDYTTVHFFGDRTDPGGNDYDIFIDPRTVGHSVQGPEDTRQQVAKIIETL